MTKIIVIILPNLFMLKAAAKLETYMFNKPVSACETFKSDLSGTKIRSMIAVALCFISRKLVCRTKTLPLLLLWCDQICQTF